MSTTLLRHLRAAVTSYRAPGLAAQDAARAAEALANDRGAPETDLGRANQRYAAELGWDFDMLAFSPWAPRPHAFDDDLGFRELQRYLGLEPDGWFGPASYSALMKKYHGHLVVAGRPHAAPQGVAVQNWHHVQGHVHRFPGSSRRGRAVTQVMCHEAVDDKMSDVQRTLTRRGLGVHLMVTPEVDEAGHVIVTQHGDLAWDRYLHAGSHNGPSVGLEFVSPYYPEHTPRSFPAGPKVDNAPWAHAGADGVRNYTMMAQRMLEAGAQLIAWLTEPEGPIGIPRAWIGLDRTRGRFAMGRVKENARRPGVWAHTYSAHADAAVPVLYAWLRLEAGLGVDEAYAATVALARSGERWVDVARWVG